MKFQTQLFFSLHTDLICRAIYIFSKTFAEEILAFFFVYFLHMCEKICTFAADFENDITIVN